MSAEYIADKLMDALPAGIEPTWDAPEQDLRSGGWFFDIESKGKTYEVLVVETR